MQQSSFHWLSSIMACGSAKWVLYHIYVNHQAESSKDLHVLGDGTNSNILASGPSHPSNQLDSVVLDDYSHRSMNDHSIRISGPDWYKNLKCLLVWISKLYPVVLSSKAEKSGSGPRCSLSQYKSCHVSFYRSGANGTLSEGDVSGQRAGQQCLFL
ncbi:hypothetical protein BV22DRAFT_241707 [Leucogyrophana mollusca]|uniref:Uncharacterized protein n=1 Tax=Leucogyrophana mollusca TaxID=85980 RepID=A0ACB8BQL6_9AGAM|nr:hypothetical protein BV22DRAFT_241707 [Leucogyrophana mollusca]